METRMKMNEVEPDSFKAMLAMEKYVSGTAVTKTQWELIKIRASQINGCAFCINSHTKEARKHGETEQRIYALNAWRETPFFTEEERAVQRHGLDDRGEGIDFRPVGLAVGQGCLGRHLGKHGEWVAAAGRKRGSP